MQPTTIKSKDNGCGTAPGKLVCNSKLACQHDRLALSIINQDKGTVHTGNGLSTNCQLLRTVAQLNRGWG